MYRRTDYSGCSRGPSTAFQRRFRVTTPGARRTKQLVCTLSTRQQREPTLRPNTWGNRRTHSVSGESRRDYPWRVVPAAFSFYSDAQNRNLFKPSRVVRVTFSDAAEKPKGFRLLLFTDVAYTAGLNGNVLYLVLQSPFRNQMCACLQRVRVNVCMCGRRGYVAYRHVL